MCRANASIRLDTAAKSNPLKEITLALLDKNPELQYLLGARYFGRHVDPAVGSVQHSQGGTMTVEPCPAD